MKNSGELTLIIERIAKLVAWPLKRLLKSEHQSGTAEHSNPGHGNPPRANPGPPGKNRVVIRGVSKRFGKTQALSNIDLDIPEGELCVLLGPSGCGKSTLLRIIAGLEPATTGTILINGTDVTDESPGNRDIAMVFQNYAIYPHMDVFHNIAFPLKLRKVPKDEIHTRVHATAKLLQLDELLQRKPFQLSGGQRQRVAMGRAIVRRPTVFLFDEPLSNLDARLRLEMRVEIAQLHRKLGATMIYVTHDQVEAMTLADRIVVISKGCIQQIDTPEGLYTNPANLMVAGFVGTPAMNFVQGRISCPIEGKKSLFRGEGIELEVPECGPPGEAVAGIRPEHVRIDPDGAFSGKVEFIEDTGSDRYAHVKLAGGAKMVLRVSPHVTLKIDDTVPLSIDEQQAHLFVDGINVRTREQPRTRQEGPGEAGS
ncbi:MAG: ABC transporter ATP-binding protein [Deltaproteobacteria bacterium]